MYATFSIALNFTLEWRKFLFISVRVKMWKVLSNRKCQNGERDVSGINRMEFFWFKEESKNHFETENLKMVSIKSEKEICGFECLNNFREIFHSCGS
jgi:hypothetical protein